MHCYRRGKTVDAQKPAIKLIWLLGNRILGTCLVHLLSAASAAVFLEHTCAVSEDSWVPKEGENGVDSAVPPQACLHHVIAGAARCQQKMQGISSPKGRTSARAPSAGRQ